MIITKTPFRMSFFGGGTDMESFFKENGGAVLSTTFDKYCYVNVRHLPRFFDYSTELSYSKTERVTNIDDIQHPAIRNAMKMLDMHEIRLTYDEEDFSRNTISFPVPNPDFVLYEWLRDLEECKGWKSKRIEAEQVYQKKSSLHIYLERAFRILGIEY